MNGCGPERYRHRPTSERRLRGENQRPREPGSVRGGPRAFTPASIKVDRLVSGVYDGLISVAEAAPKSTAATVRSRLQRRRRMSKIFELLKPEHRGADRKSAMGRTPRTARRAARTGHLRHHRAAGREGPHRRPAASARGRCSRRSSPTWRTRRRQNLLKALTTEETRMILAGLSPDDRAEFLEELARSGHSEDAEPALPPRIAGKHCSFSATPTRAWAAS